MIVLLRILHVLGGACWLGGSGALALFLLPRIDPVDSLGGQFIQPLLARTKIVAYLPVVGLVTIATGFALYHHAMSISTASFASSPTALAYGIGAVAAILALALDLTLAVASAWRLTTIFAAVTASGAAPSSDAVQRIGVLKARMRNGMRASFALVLLATLTMSVARYL